MAHSLKTTYEGQWWSPDDSEQKFLGVLTFSPKKGLELELKVPGKQTATSHESPRVIHGYDQHGKPVTLFYCGWSGTSFSGGLTTLRYHPGYCFHGVHILRWSEAAFDEVTAHFTDLEPWVDITGLSKRPQAWTIKYKRPEEITISSRQGFRLILAANVNQKSGGELQSIEESWLMRLQYVRSTPFHSIRSHLLKIRQFLMLAAQRPVFQTYFVGRRKVDREMLGSIWLGREITCFTPGMERDDSIQDKKRSQELLFTFGDVREHFPTMLSKWLEYSVTFKDALSLYFACLENKSLYGNHQVLFLAQALEVYHRTHEKRYKQAIESRDAFRARCKKLVAGLAKGDAQWLKEKLVWSNQPTLNERLLDIFESQRSILGSYLGDEKALAKRIKDLRNHYTHYTVRGGKTKNNDFPRDFFDLCHKMKVTLEVCFLSDIGVPANILKKLLRDVDWVVTHFDEADEEDPPSPAPATRLLKAPVRRGKKNDETAYLLRSPANRESLLATIVDVKAGATSLSLTRARFNEAGAFPP